MIIAVGHNGNEAENEGPGKEIKNSADLCASSAFKIQGVSRTISMKLGEICQ